MVDLPSSPDAGSVPAGTPRWVKVFGIIALVVVLLFVAQFLVHGPGRHLPSGNTVHHPSPVQRP